MEMLAFRVQTKELISPLATNTDIYILYEVVIPQFLIRNRVDST